MTTKIVDYFIVPRALPMSERIPQDVIHALIRLHRTKPPLASMSIAELSDNDWLAYTGSVDADTLSSGICNELQQDSNFTAELQMYQCWNCKDVKNSIAYMKAIMFNAVASMSTATDIRAQGDAVPLHQAFSTVVRPHTTSFWVEHVRANIKADNEGYENAVWGILRCMFGPSIQWEVPRIDTIKACISWLVSLQNRNKAWERSHTLPSAERRSSLATLDTND